VKEFNYLGLLLTKTGTFERAIKTLADKGTNAMYEILKRGKFHNLSISCQLDLFDKMVNPILLFCVLHKWYIKRYTTEQIFDCFPVISLIQYDTIRCFISI
jgi:hypothetical protein